MLKFTRFSLAQAKFIGKKEGFCGNVEGGKSYIILFLEYCQDLDDNQKH